MNRHTPYESNILITTKDAHTLTHGPSIYLANDIEKVARFYLQQTKIPSTVIDKINEHVRKNDKMRWFAPGPLWKYSGGQQSFDCVPQEYTQSPPGYPEECPSGGAGPFRISR